ncbi:hypothetical protein [Candidatus Fukatsuia endosymbiont of Tuberolachnus salignus]|uniref:hypothetical protein n=1 Tax=Candidatus Fukatsuia endosymbiont of Tuberolachnus salignus TaxID=3077957 RepID=UPI00313EC4DE
MPKKIIFFYLTAIGSGCLLGIFFGIFHAYYNPMYQLSGYWKNNYFLSTQNGQYHINSRVSIMGQVIKFSSDVYDEQAMLKVSRNLFYRVVDIKNNTFEREIISMTPNDIDDEVLNLLLKNPIFISRPTFYVLDNKTILLELSQSHILASVRLLKRSDRVPFAE